jgi:hypothetical protein
VNPGTPVIVEIRGDIYDNSGTQDLINGVTLQAQLVAGSSNGQLTKSLSYFNAPASTVQANTVTIAQGTLSVAKYAAYANQTTVAPKTAYKVAEFTVSGNSTESINLNTLTVNFDGSGAASVQVASALQNLYVVYGNQTSSTKSTVASTTNTYNINKTLNAGESINVAVYADVTTSAASGNVFSTTLTVSGQTSQSNQTVSATAVQGQTVTIAAGSLSIAKDASSPVSDLVVAGASPVKVGSFKISANNDAYTVTDLAVSMSSNQGSVQNFTLKDGATTLAANVPFTSASVATTTGLSLVIPANSSKVVDVYAALSPVGTPGYATTSASVAVSLAGLKANSSSGTLTQDYTGYAANTLYVVKSRPTVSNLALPSTSLAAGTQTLAKVQVSSDAAGAIAWDKITFSVTKTNAVTITGNSWALYEDGNSTAIAGTFATSSTLASTGAVTGTVSFTPTSEQQVSGSKTYILKATIGGSISSTNGDSVSTNIASGVSTPAAANTAAVVASTAATFVWSDLSVQPHSTTSADWMNDAYVRSIPSDSQTLHF